MSLETIKLIPSDRCPHLGLSYDPATITAYPSAANCCHNSPHPLPVLAAHQERFCLTGEYSRCPVFQGETTSPPPYADERLSHLSAGTRRPRWLPAAAAIAIVAAILLLLVFWQRGSNGALFVAGPASPTATATEAAGSAAAATNSPTPTQTPSPTAVPSATPSLTPTATNTPTAIPTATATVTPIPPTATPSATPSITPTPQPQASVLVERLNARAGPGTAYPVIQIIERGDIFVVTGRNRTGDWWQICCLGEQSGWVFAESMSLDADPATLPLVEDIPPP